MMDIPLVPDSQIRCYSGRNETEANGLTIFELVKLALDELYQEGINEHGASKIDAEIIDRITYLQKSYGNLESTSRTPVSYRDPACRFAYVYKYVASHGDYLVQALEMLRSTLGGNIFSNEMLRLTCVGGGPGSDIIGILKYLADQESEPIKKLTCYLLDGEQAWADTWTEIDESLKSDVSANVNFQKLDVIDPDSWSAQKRFLKSDLFTLSYFVSEVMSLDGDGVVSNFWKRLFDEANAGAVFVYVDNGASSFNDYFDAHWNTRSNFECLYRMNNTWWTPSYTEQASELATYKAKFGQSPKLRSKLSIRILRKK